MVFLHSLSLAPRSTYSPFSSTIVPLFSIKQLSNFQYPNKLNSFVGEQWHSLPILLRSFATPVSVPRSTQNESDSSPLSPISIVTFHTLSNVFHNFLKKFSSPPPPAYEKWAQPHTPIPRRPVSGATPAIAFRSAKHRRVVLSLFALISFPKINTFQHTLNNQPIATSHLAFTHIIPSQPPLVNHFYKNSSHRVN